MTFAATDGPMVRLLGEIDVVGPVVALTPQQEALVGLLAVNGPSSRSTIVDGLWNGRPISDSRFSNLIAETRARLGRHHLPEASAGRYHISAVETDLDRLDAHLGRAADAIDPVVRRQALAAVLALVRGMPFTPGRGRYWAWLDQLGGRPAAVEARVGDATLQLVELCLAVGDDRAAALACERGLLACPLDDRIVAALADVYRSRGLDGPAARVIEVWRGRLRRLEAG